MLTRRHLIDNYLSGLPSIEKPRLDEPSSKRLGKAGLKRKRANGNATVTPLWVRTWHWVIAVLFVALVYTGVVLTYSTSDFALMNYELADNLHQVAGIIMSILYGVFVVVVFASGYWRRYQRRYQGLWSRIRLHGANVMSADSSGQTSEISRVERTRPVLLLVQQFLYIFSIVIVSPLLVITGIALLYPELAPAEIAGLNGLWPMALAHIWVGLAGALFLLFHIYIATIGGFIRMIGGK